MSAPHCHDCGRLMRAISARTDEVWGEVTIWQCDSCKRVESYRAAPPAPKGDN